MASRPLIIVDISEPGLDGILERFGSTTKSSPREFTRYDGNEFDFQFVEKTGNDQTPFRIADLTGYTIQSAIGELDDAPTAGTFDLAYNSSSTGLTGLAYNITGANLQTALNAHAGVSAAGGVTVTQFDNSYQILFNTVGDKADFTSDATALIPECYASLTKTQAGSASVKEIWWLRLVQKPLAFTDSFVAGTVGSADVTVLQAGSATLAEVQRISLDLPSYDGTIIINAAVKQEVKLACRADDSGDLHETGVIFEDANGTVGIWMDVGGGGTAPAEILACDRQIEITGVTNGMSAANVAAQWQSTVDADSQFEVTASGNVVTIRQASAGARIEPTDVGTDFGITVAQAGVLTTAAVPTSADANQMAAALEGVVNVVKSGTYQWDITFPSPGDQDLITVDASALFQTVYTASLSLATQQAFRRFASEDPDTDEIEVPWEISITPSGGSPVTVYRQDHIVARDVITPDVSASNQLPTSLTAVRTTNTVWVDAEYGSDSTGTRERLDLPFQTPEAAESAASSSDRIVVRKGGYSISSALGAKAIFWDFESGVAISAESSVVFNVSTGISVRVRGGVDTRLTSSFGNAFVVSSGTASVTIEDIALEAEASDSGLVVSNSSAAGVKVDRCTISGMTNGIAVSGGTVSVKRSRIVGLDTASPGINKTGGTLKLRENEVLGESGNSITGSGTVLAWNNVWNLATTGVAISGANNTTDSNLT